MIRTSTLWLFATILLLSPISNAADKVGPRERLKCANNLKLLGLAFHNYHDTHKQFPATASYDKEEKPLLSWRVHILRFLGEKALYDRFHLDEPWDSEHNKKLVAEIPKVFGCPVHDLQMKGKTTYLAPHGEGLAFEGTKGTRIRDFIDGTANTILVVETEPDQAVIWTKPADLEIDLDKARGLGAAHEKGTNTLYCDGSVHFIPKDIDIDTLKVLLQRNDRQPVPQF